MPAVDEMARLDALRRLDLLDTSPNESFDRITRMAGQLFNLPIAAVSLTDSDRQWFKSRIGFDQTAIPRYQAPCAAVAVGRTTVVIEDCLVHPLYKDSPLASSGIRFYAGAPLITRDGFGLGAMCVLGTEPRQITRAEQTTLEDPAAMVMSQIELQHAFGRIDAVSELPNRVQFMEDLQDLAIDCGGERRLAVLFDLIGVDELNRVARVMGPGIVDDLVKEAARNLRALVTPKRKAYHVGATQLAFLAPPELDEAGCDDLLTSHWPQLGRLIGQNAAATLAVGVAPFFPGEMAPLHVLRIAQGTAQDARAAGKPFAFHSSSEDTAFKRRFRLRRDFEDTIRLPDNLRLVYQPRVDTATGRCVSVEALLRWTHPALGAVAPDEFIPLIEQTPLAAATTAWVIDTAACQLAQWAARGLAIGVSVNISAANLRHADFAASVLRAVAMHAIPAHLLELEITESTLMSDGAMTLAQLERLAAAGIRLAIDDFGTGYSSLSYLQRLPVHVVKIDRSFMTDLDTDPRQLSLVTMMIAMAKHLNHCVVAEGVETAAVVACLRETACDQIQGYVFARPMPADDFERWYRDRHTDPVAVPAAA